MRILLFILNLLIGASLAVHSHDGMAASSAKMGKSKSHKAARNLTKNKKSSHPGDVWVRIRSGMSIPHPQAAGSASYSHKFSVRQNANSSPPLQAGLAASSATQTSKLPQNTYTELGRQKLAKHNYTALGKKLLGAATQPIDDGGCEPAISTSLIGTSHKTGQSSTPDKTLRPNRESSDRLRTRTVIGVPKQAGDRRPATTADAETSRFNRFAGASGRKSPCPSSHIASSSQNNSKTSGTSAVNHFALNGVENKQAEINERINRQIALYAQKQDFLHRVANRAHPYLYHIVDKLSSHRLPLELALLPIVESAYLPTAESSKSARGLWQFIPSTGSDYHLEQQSNYDERLDVTQSTEAAIRFLSGLNAHYHGDWLLALAAYNAGPGTVDQAIAANQAKGLATDYWSLILPEETQNYVPRFLALSKIFANPGGFGVKLPVVRNEPYFIKVKFNREFDVNYLADKNIDVVARLADLSSEQFCRLNPAFLGSTLAKRDAYAFLLPPDSADELRQNLARIAQFMSEPAMAVNSVVIKEYSQSGDLSDPSLSLISELVLDKPAHEAKLSVPFLSLNVGNGKNGLPLSKSPLGTAA